MTTASKTATLTTIAPQLLVQDVAQTTAYYRDVLGFEVGMSGSYGIVNRGPISLHFIKYAKTGEGQPVGNNDDLGKMSDVYIETDNVEALYAEFVAKGATVNGEPKVTPWGMKQFEVTDCNAYVLVFGQDV